MTTYGVMLTLADGQQRLLEDPTRPHGECLRIFTDFDAADSACEELRRWHPRERCDVVPMQLRPALLVEATA